ncbi:MAG TPA: hypothetical protein VFJ81_12910 [Gemmatimonadales bacterium]|nr:hypothetical protein [Gemmatimonadales bacterium]
MTTYIVFIRASEELEPGHRTIRFDVDSIREGIGEIRSFLAKRGIRGEWGVLLDTRDGTLRRRYVTRANGIVDRKDI